MKLPRSLGGAKLVNRPVSPNFFVQLIEFAFILSACQYFTYMKLLKNYPTIQSSDNI
jgi:hypothetical protein